MTRRLLTAGVALLAFAATASAHHPKGGSTHFFGLTWGHAPVGGVVGNNAVVGSNAVVAAPTVIGTNAVVAAPTVVGTNAVVYPHTVVGTNAVIGTNAVVYPHVVVGSNAVVAAPTVIGTNAVVAAPTVVGTNATVGANATTGGVTSQDIAGLADAISGLRTDLATIQQTQNAILGEVRSIRVKLGGEAPAAPTAPAPGNLGTPRPKKTTEAPAVRPAMAAMDRDRAEIAAAHDEIAAMRAAAKARAEARAKSPSAVAGR